MSARTCTKTRKHRDALSALGAAGLRAGLLTTRMLPPRRRRLFAPLISVFMFPSPDLSG